MNGPKNGAESHSSAKDEPRHGVDAVREWRYGGAWIVSGTLLFLSLSGLSLFFSAFSVYQQILLMLHVVVGLGLLIPVFGYVAKHERRRRAGNWSHYKLLGYLAGVILAVSYGSGLVVSGQAVFGTRLVRSWDQAHLISGVVLMLVVIAHVLTVAFRASGQSELRYARRVYFVRSIALGFSGFILCGVLAWQYGAVRFDEAFPATYGFKYGVDRPFAPSLARKDMSLAEEKLRTDVSAQLTDEQARMFLANLKVDPSEHAGLVSVAERLVGGMALSETQQEKVDQILAEVRDLYRTNGRIDPRRMAGSQSCGTTGCHSEILAEWEPSAHRYAAMDIVFQRVQEIMAEEKDPQSTRYCAGCHDPISLFAGAKNTENITLSSHGVDEGISCVSCHGIVQADVRGNADYTIDVSEPYLFEYHEGAFAKRVSDFLIRAYPRHHVAAYSRPLYKTTEFCAACHKQFIDEEVNDFGWVQGQNQYDSWRKSRWHHEDNPDATLSCRECHMPLVDSLDPARGDFQDPTRSPDDGKHRSHRTLGANQFIPLYHELPGAEEQVAMIVQWLKGDYEIPEVAHKWTEGPVVRLHLGVPEEVTRGEEIEIRTHLTNNKTGHNFPTGPLDMIEAWVELTVVDERGKVVFSSGSLDDKDYLENPQIVFKKELVDQEGNAVDRHNLWDAVGATYKRALFPGFTDTTEFKFHCPAMSAESGEEPGEESEEIGQTVKLPDDLAASVLSVKATLWYSKFKAPFMDKVFPPETRMRAPATAISEASATIRVVAE